MMGKLKLEATSKYSKGYGWVEGVSIKTSPRWKQYKEALLNGRVVSYNGRGYRIAKGE